MIIRRGDDLSCDYSLDDREQSDTLICLIGITFAIETGQNAACMVEANHLPLLAIEHWAA